MNPTSNTSLAPYTSFGVGGPAERLFVCDSSEQLMSALDAASNDQLWVLGYGANVLIADEGLPGTVVVTRSQSIELENDSSTIVAEAGVWWDDLVQFAIARGLWGQELMSAIPGGVGAAVVGNIAAYGQAVADTLLWVEVYDRASKQIRRLTPSEIGLSYRFSLFQTGTLRSLVILRAAFGLSERPTTELTYQSALDVAQELQCDLANLAGRRQTILETRRRAGSLWDYRTTDAQVHTAGSFFRNPLVDDETAEKLMAQDETGRTAAMLKQMNLVHGGAQKRVSAAHVLLAAGFTRGQSWGPVRLHPDHILKIENTGGATAQNIYDVAQEIIATVQAKLGVELVPEVRFIGDFNATQ